MCFLREIDDIEESVRKNLNIAKTYIDVDRNNKIDDASKLLLNDLKTNKIVAIKRIIFDTKVSSKYKE